MEGQPMDGTAAGGAPPMVGGMALNLIVLKEPRGMIRIIQIIFGILAFATTTSFDTESVLMVTCPPEAVGKEQFKSKIVYPIEYPFKFQETTILEKYNCSKQIPMIQQKFPMDFSSSAQFFVATGFLAFVYSAAALGFYLTKSDKYAMNPLLPVIDLGITGLLSVFWVAGACAWGMGVSDLKYYTHPRQLAEHIYICKDVSSDCSTVDLGNWATLNISLLFGFANAFIWCMSGWFVFKETSFHQRNVPMPVGNQYPPGYEPQPPFQQAFPPQQQFAGQY